MEYLVPRTLPLPLACHDLILMQAPCLKRMEMRNRTLFVLNIATYILTFFLLFMIGNFFLTLYQSFSIFFYDPVKTANIFQIAYIYTAITLTFFNQNLSLN